MSDFQSISLNINSVELTEFCQKLLQSSSNISRTHDTLLTLESFISIFSQQAHGSREYLAIESTIKPIIEINRQKLLKKNTLDMIAALKQCNVLVLAAIHSSLPKNEFYQIFKTSIAELSDDEIRLLMIWSNNWLKEAKQLAKKISGDFDSIDFKKTGMNIDEFHVVSDIDRVLNPHD